MFIYYYVVLIGKTEITGEEEEVVAKVDVYDESRQMLESSIKEEQLKEAISKEVV